jgi:hypothetical protein
MERRKNLEEASHDEQLVAFHWNGFVVRVPTKINDQIEKWVRNKLKDKICDGSYSNQAISPHHSATGGSAYSRIRGTIPRWLALEVASLVELLAIVSSGCYEAGLAEGTSLLHQLNSGRLSVEDFERKSKTT